MIYNEDVTAVNMDVGRNKCKIGPSSGERTQWGRDKTWPMVEELTQEKR